MAGLEDFVVRHVFGLEVARAGDAFEEGVFDDAQEGGADGVGPVDGAVEVPAAEVELGCYGVHFGVGQGEEEVV